MFYIKIRGLNYFCNFFPFFQKLCNFFNIKWFIWYSVGVITWIKKSFLSRNRTFKALYKIKTHALLDQ